MVKGLGGRMGGWSGGGMDWLGGGIGGWFCIVLGEVDSLEDDWASGLVDNSPM